MSTRYPQHDKAMYEGDGDPGCVTSCERCKVDALRETLESIRRWARGEGDLNEAAVEIIEPLGETLRRSMRLRAEVERVRKEYDLLRAVMRAIAMETPADVE